MEKVIVHAYQNAFAITPSDTVDLAHVVDAIYVGGVGSVKVDMGESGTVTLTAVPVGTLLRGIGARRVYSTGTSATNLIGFY